MAAALHFVFSQRIGARRRWRCQPWSSAAQGLPVAEHQWRLQAGGVETVTQGRQVSIQPPLPPTRQRGNQWVKE